MLVVVTTLSSFSCSSMRCHFRAIWIISQKRKDERSNKTFEENAVWPWPYSRIKYCRNIVNIPWERYYVLFLFIWHHLYLLKSETIWLITNLCTLTQKDRSWTMSVLSFYLPLWFIFVLIALLDPLPHKKRFIVSL